MKTITTKCVNGDIQAGDIVISTPDDDFDCLIGRVMKINLLGTPEHDEETANETDDVHVNFLEFEYSKKRTAEIEEDFCSSYGVKQSLEEYALDDVIMAPCCLIRITDIDEPSLDWLLQSGYNAACYCYGILSSLTDQIELEPQQAPTIGLIPNEMECLNHADSGFKITRIIHGKKVDIELASQELSAAFYYQERKYYTSDIEIVLEEMETDGKLQGHTAKSIRSNDVLMEKILSEYEKNRDDYQMEWHHAALEAIGDALASMEHDNVS